MNGKITEKETARINELARKSKAEGLTEAEKKEQKELRERYLEAIRMNLRSQLNNIDVLNHDGKIENWEKNMEIKKDSREQNEMEMQLNRIGEEACRAETVLRNLDSERKNLGPARYSRGLSVSYGSDP